MHVRSTGRPALAIALALATAACVGGDDAAGGRAVGDERFESPGPTLTTAAPQTTVAVASPAPDPLPALRLSSPPAGYRDGVVEPGSTDSSYIVVYARRAHPTEPRLDPARVSIVAVAGAGPLDDHHMYADQGDVHIRGGRRARHDRVTRGDGSVDPNGRRGLIWDEARDVRVEVWALTGLDELVALAETIVVR